MTAAALGALVPAVIGLLLAGRAYLTARASQITAENAADSAGAAHERLDALGAVRPPQPPEEQLEHEQRLEQLRAALQEGNGDGSASPHH